MGARTAPFAISRHAILAALVARARVESVPALADATGIPQSTLYRVAVTRVISTANAAKLARIGIDAAEIANLFEVRDAPGAKGRGR